jgi:glycosyltransferase involved in cell wall biosynthesis
MWGQILPRPLAGLGRITEARLAPPFYRRTRVVTPSEDTRQELLGLGFHAEMVTAVPNGVDEFFSPGAERSPEPLVVAVGRFAPVKRFELTIAAALEAKKVVPTLRVRLIGDGPLRDQLAALIDRHGASDWIDLVGRVPRVQLRDEYRRAWVALSASLAEGWGLTLTEAAACGTPAVATDIAGHRCSVVDGTTGVLAAPADLGAALAGVLSHPARRDALGAAALARSRTLTWDASATGVLAALHHEVVTRRPSPR